MKSLKKKIKLEINKPKTCGECPFFSYESYRCHAESGYVSDCSLGYMQEDMRDRDYTYKLYEKCQLK